METDTALHAPGEATGRDEDKERELAAHRDAVRSSPGDTGLVIALVRRPDTERRVVLDVALLDPVEGLVGDNWRARGSRKTPDGSADPQAQLTLMSTRVLAAIEPDPARWPLAGDQLLVDFDLSMATLPAGTRLVIGEAELEITPKPHTGCAKFSARFGPDALRWISTPEGQALRLRGVHARVVRGGSVRVGDTIRRA